MRWETVATVHDVTSIERAFEGATFVEAQAVGSCYVRLLFRFEHIHFAVTAPLESIERFDDVREKKKT